MALLVDKENGDSCSNCSLTINLVNKLSLDTDIISNESPTIDRRSPDDKTIKDDDDLPIIDRMNPTAYAKHY